METEFVRTTPTELRRRLRGWREPLAEAVRRRVTNPFTRQPYEGWSWDPSPDVSVAPSSEDVPWPSIEMLGFEHVGVIALLAVVLPIDAPSLRRTMFPDAAELASDRRPALIGPEEGPWIWEVPPPLVAALAEMDANAIAAAGPRWAVALRDEVKRLDPTSVDLLEDGFYVDALARLAAFAREAVAAGEHVYEWVAD